MQLDGTLPGQDRATVNSESHDKRRDDRSDQNPLRASSNENKMSDGGRERASLGVERWKSSSM